MPYYQIAAPAGLLTQEQRAKIAKVVTRHHCDETGAPESFVHVHYLEVPSGTHFTGGEVDDDLVVLSGSIREGRSIKERQQLLHKLSKGISDVLDKPENELVLSLDEITSATTMEFGLILPQPGGEPDWFEKNKEALKGVTGTGL
jgi:phenylpyruvate tautomerase PptA (4-oxalocrotonate tautomerase family)